jgi:hypothetical protein
MIRICLVNSISGRGHLDSYARLYSRALLELGYDVTLLAQGDSGVASYIERRSGASIERFSFYGLEVSSTSDEDKLSSKYNLLYEKIYVIIQRDGLFSLVRRSFRYAKRRLGDKFSTYFHSIASQRSSRSKADYAIDDHLIQFDHFVQGVSNVERAEGFRAFDLIIYLYLDMMTRSPSRFSCLDSNRARPWVGIRFHPQAKAGDMAMLEPYFNSINARGAIFLVPEAIAPYSAARQDLYFVLVPDVADLELAEEPHELAKAMRRGAGDRKIALQIGSIAPHKGIMTLLDIIARADPKRFFFALIGEVHWESFGADQDRLRAFYASPPENVLIHEGYIGDERDYNTIVTACDVIYAVYENFNSSSNSLTKAAGLRRPILVSRDTLMGDRVTAAGLGIAVRPKDSADILDGLAVATQVPTDHFNYETYARAHSLEQLKAVLADAVPSWCRRGLDDTSPSGTKL